MQTTTTYLLDELPSAGEVSGHGYGRAMVTTASGIRGERRKRAWERGESGEAI
jgi:hypothetical protein